MSNLEENTIGSEDDVSFLDDNHGAGRYMYDQPLDQLRYSSSFDKCGLGGDHAYIAQYIIGRQLIGISGGPGPHPEAWLAIRNEDNQFWITTRQDWPSPRKLLPDDCTSFAKLQSEYAKLQLDYIGWIPFPVKTMPYVTEKQIAFALSDAAQRSDWPRAKEGAKELARIFEPTD